ncbi:E3 ubiquitin-protein ligase pellino-like protein 1, partial [Cryptotermes secundus]
YNGFLPPGDRGRRRSKFVLYKRTSSNGVKRSKHYVVKTPHSSQGALTNTFFTEDTNLSTSGKFARIVSATRCNPWAILDTEQHSISYTLSRNQAVIVEYMPDEETDMFQIGRSSESPIDFVVMDTIPGDKTGESKVLQSTISRFACRILCDRSNPRVAKIFAAGFDSSRNIFLGSRRIGWAKVDDETNVLQDGTLIDLCGATLLWRSHEGLEKSPTKHHLETLIDELNAGRPQCPVGLNTLVIPRKLTLSMSDETVNAKQQPYVYLNCGHVQGHHDWGQDKDSKDRRCPMCLEMGPVVKMCMGIEPAFYVDAGRPTFAFNPCGHMATEKTVKYWANVAIPHGTNGFDAVCPFCATPLFGCPGYVRLIFQDNVD